MGYKSWILFATTIIFATMCSPTITHAQWPITADPSLTQNALNNPSNGKNNQTPPE
ncbi:MAG TPA: hypothetical protein VJS91_00435 [Nitrososphaeraceae archaeon]|nr:hypothetical protein [Nitrososphaeraceae archaeon]